VWLWREKQIFGERVVGWAADGVLIPLQGQAITYAGPDYGRISVRDLARLGLIRHSWAGPDSTVRTTTYSAPEQFGKAIAAVAMHLAEVGL
jgi:hypothetical protein